MVYLQLSGGQNGSKEKKKFHWTGTALEKRYGVEGTKPEIYSRDCTRRRIVYVNGRNLRRLQDNTETRVASEFYSREKKRQRSLF